MPKYLVTSPEGQKYEVTAPEGATQEQVLTYAKSQFSKPAAAAPPAAQPATTEEKVLGSVPGRAALGAASILTGPLQLGMNIGSKISGALGGATTGPGSGQWINEGLKELEAKKQRGMAAAGKTGTDWAGIGGAVASGGAAASGLSTVTGIGPKILQGAAVGAGLGAAQPVTSGEDFAGEKATQTALGATVGGAIPAVAGAIGRAASAGKRMAEPFTKSGQAAILKRYQESLMGNDPTVKAKVIRALQQAKTIVPGSKPTAGEALTGIPEATGLASHQRAVAKIEGVSPQFNARSTEQEAARRKLIATIAKTPAALDQAVAARAAIAKANYGTAGREIVESDAALTELLARPSMSHILSRAKDLAKEQGKDFQIGVNAPAKTVASAIVGPQGRPFTKTIPATTAKYPVESLHFMKMAMDDLTKNPERFAIGASESRAIGATQKKFVEWLGQKSPAYETARADFKWGSEPINRMQVGQELEKALTSSLGTTERGTIFANAMRNAPQTLKRATGQPRYSELSEVLTPQERSAANKVAAELARKDAFKQMAAKTNFSGAKAIHEGTQFPNLLSRPAMIANYLMKTLGAGPAQEKINRMAAAEYLTPQKLADALKDVPASQRYQIVDGLLKQAPGLGAILAARQGGQ